MNKSDLSRNAYLLNGSLAKKGYMRWWHSFTGTSSETGDRRVFFIEYLIMNPALGHEEPVLGQLPANRKRKIKPSYVMIKAGAFAGDSGTKAVQLNAFYPMNELKIALNPLVIQTGENFYSENHIYGFINVPHDKARRRSHMCDEGCMEWDLEVHKAISCHTGRIAGPFFCAVKALETFWHGEGIKSLYQGSVTLNGVTYEAVPETSYGYADKHWGRAFNNPWLQLGCCCLTSQRTGKELKHSAIAVDGCRPRFLFLRLKRRLILQLTYEGEDFEINFSRWGTFSRCKWNRRQTRKRNIWQIASWNKDTIIKITAGCLCEEMMTINYEAPNGTLPKTPLLGTGSADGKILLYRRVPGGKELIDTLIMKNVFCEFNE